jgi:transcriptional regulator with XRE-family HTH domain
MEGLPMPFAEALKRWREGAGLTQSALADATGLGLGTVRDYEQGKKEPTLRSAARLAAALGVSLADLANSLDADPGGASAAPRALGRPRKTPPAAPGPPPAEGLEGQATKRRRQKEFAEGPAPAGKGPTARKGK